MVERQSVVRIREEKAKLVRERRKTRDEGAPVTGRYLYYFVCAYLCTTMGTTAARHLLSSVTRYYVRSTSRVESAGPRRALAGKGGRDCVMYYVHMYIVRCTDVYMTSYLVQGSSTVDISQ